MCDFLDLVFLYLIFKFYKLGPILSAVMFYSKCNVRKPVLAWSAHRKIIMLRFCSSFVFFLFFFFASSTKWIIKANQIVSTWRFMRFGFSFGKCEFDYLIEHTASFSIAELTIGWRIRFSSFYSYSLYDIGCDIIQSIPNKYLLKLPEEIER